MDIKKLKRHYRIFKVCQIILVVYILLSISMVVVMEMAVVTEEKLPAENSGSTENFGPICGIILIVLIVLIAKQKQSMIKMIDENVPKRNILTIINPLLQKEDDRKRREELYKKALKLIKDDRLGLL